MISLYRIKPFYQKLFRGAAGQWMSPDMATVFGVFFSLVAGAGIYLGGTVHRAYFVLVPAGLIFRMGANALDGMLAREKGLASPLGAVLNEVTDVLNDLVCYVPFWFVPGMNRGVLMAFLLSILFAEFSGLLGQAVNGQRRYEGPLGGKTDRAFWVGLWCFSVVFAPTLLARLSSYLLFVSVLVNVTAFNRLRLIVQSSSGGR